MMIDGHHIETQRLGLHQRLDAGGAAIDGDQELRALFGKRADRFGVRPIAFEQPVGNVDERLEPAMAQEFCQHRR